MAISRRQATGTPARGVAAAGDTSSNELAREIEKFLLYLRDVRQLSPHTLGSYQRDLQTLHRHCVEHDKIRAEQLVESDIRQWVSQLHRRGLAGSSIQRSLSAARSFFNYLGRETGRPRNPATSVQAPRKPRKLPRTLDADQVNSSFRSMRIR